jgi:hypothetical protein
MIDPAYPYQPPPERAPDPGASLDEPLDAIIYDVHPAFLARRNALRAWPLLNFQAEPAKYKVPPRFGMSAILGIMTALALLFGSFRIMNAPPVVYLFFGLQTIVICVVQMAHGKTPRLASAIAGAVLAPIFTVVLANEEIPMSRAERYFFATFALMFSVPVGAFLGYLTGTCSAGIFLVMDYAEQYWEGRHWSSLSDREAV